MRQSIAIITLLLIGLLLGGCSGEAEPIASGPDKMSRADNCHICGMIVLDQQGPKGQVRLQGGGKPAYFCSTSDLMAFLFQPDSPAIVREAWVHNMHNANWQSPENHSHAYIDAFSAYYVVDHSRRGAMGHTLAPFAEQAQAEAFIADYGGRILRYQDIDVDLIASMASYAFPDFNTVRDFDPEVELGGGHHSH
jgi:copper chaperone NosL